MEAMREIFAASEKVTLLEQGVPIKTEAELDRYTKSAGNLHFVFKQK
jgi:hypothetical protein